MQATTIRKVEYHSDPSYTKATENLLKAELVKLMVKDEDAAKELAEKWGIEM